MTQEILDRLKSQQGDISHIREHMAVFVEKTAGIVSRLDKHEAQLQPLTKAHHFVQVAAKILTILGTLAALGLAWSKIAYAEEYPARIGIEVADSPGVVRIFSQGGGHCTGFVIATNRIMTAAHCSDSLYDVGQAQFSDGKIVPYTVVVRGEMATADDIEILSADTAGRLPIVIAEQNTFPSIGVFMSAREARIKAFPVLLTDLETDQPSLLSQVMGAAQKEGLGHGYGQVIPGDSGSAILNAHGELCGIVTMRALDGTLNFWFAPVSKIRQYAIRAFQSPNK